MTSTKYIVLPQAANVEWGDELYGDLEIRSDGKQHSLMDFQFIHNILLFS